MKSRRTPLTIAAVGALALAALSSDFNCEDKGLDTGRSPQSLDGGEAGQEVEQEPITEPVLETRKEIAEVVDLDDVLDGAPDVVTSLYRDCDFSFYGDDALKADWKAWEGQQSEAVNAILSDIVRDCADQKKLDSDLERQRAQAKIEAMLDFRDDLEETLKEKGCVIERNLGMTPRFEIVLSEGGLSDGQWDIIEETEDENGSLVADTLTQTLVSLSKEVLSVRVNTPEYNDEGLLVGYGAVVTGENAGEEVDIQISSDSSDEAFDALVNEIMAELKGC